MNDPIERWPDRLIWQEDVGEPIEIEWRHSGGLADMWFLTIAGVHLL